MRYVKAGKGPAAVMVHGNPTWSFYFRNLIVALEGERTCYAPDHIGCGRSDKPKRSEYAYTMAQRIADFSQFMASQVREPVDLIVHDWGGMIGMGWAVDHPELVRSITVLNTAAFRLPQAARIPWALHLARTPILGALAVRGLNSFVLGANALCVKRRPLADSIARGLAAPYNSWGARVAVHEFVRDIPLSPNDPSWPKLVDIESKLSRLRGVPMLICWGMMDFVFTPPYLEEWIARFPAAAVHRFADAGHYILEDAGNEVNALVMDFIRTHSEASVPPPRPAGEIQTEG
jgi:haloalkane dehalogenase